MFILHFKMPLRVYYEIPSQERKEYFANSCLYNVSFGERTLLGRNWESRLRAQHHPLIPRWCARQLLPPATLLCAAWGNCVLTQQRCCHEVRVFWSRSEPVTQATSQRISRPTLRNRWKSANATNHSYFSPPGESAVKHLLACHCV